MNKNNNIVTIMIQAFYGNRTVTTVKEKDIDALVLGYVDSNLLKDKDRINRTIINIPNSDNLVLVYNKNQEQKKIEKIINRGLSVKPTAIIPEINLTLYSRCFVSRIDENGELCSIKESDVDKFINYLSE